MRYVVLLLLILPQIVIADNAELEVLGVQTGMSFEKFVKLYPECETAFITPEEFSTKKTTDFGEPIFMRDTLYPEAPYSVFINKKIRYSCKIKGWDVTSAGFTTADDGNQLFSFKVERGINDIDLEAMKKKVLSKYGKPDCAHEETITPKSIIIRSSFAFIDYCWGQCEKTNNDSCEKNLGKGESLIFEFEESWNRMSFT